jgi:hypothetical protein
MGSFLWLVRSPSSATIFDYFLMGFGLGFEESALIPNVCFSLLRGFSKTPTSSFVARLACNWKLINNHL